jgi:hypothetical protein
MTARTNETQIHALIYLNIPFLSYSACLLAASIKFFISIMLVIGPVPPGTGVIIPATFTISSFSQIILKYPTYLYIILAQARIHQELQNIFDFINGFQLEFTPYSDTGLE